MTNHSMKNKSFQRALLNDLKLHKYKYLIILPVLIYLFLFAYKPMYGLIIAFKQYRPSLGILESPWVGFEHFKTFFTDVYFTRIIKNTFVLSFLNILWGFPAPIILAILLNEIRSTFFKRTVQTISYMPYFISIVVMCGLLKSFCMTDGVFNDIIVFFGGTRSSLLSNPNLFRTLYVATDIWQNVGWGTIIYLATLTGIDPQQYEAAKIDGAGRFRQIIYITLPGLMPTITMLFILRMGSVLNIGYEKVLLMYQPATYEVADVISTYVYRVGMLDGNWSYSTAIGLFNSVVNVIFLVTTNQLSKKINGMELF